MRRRGKALRFVGGLRVTDEETMELVEMVLVGKINPELVTAPELRAAATFYRSPEGTAIRQKLPQVIDGIMPLIQNELVRTTRRLSRWPRRRGPHAVGQITTIGGAPSMKKVEAIVQPFKLIEVKEALAQLGVTTLTVSEVRGADRGERHTETYRGQEYVVDFTPRLKVDIVVADTRVDGR